MSRYSHIISEMLPFKASMIYIVRGIRRNNYDMLVNHARLDRRQMDLVVPRAQYISIIRNPETQLESTFSYYRMAIKLNLTGTNQFQVFMSHPATYYDMKPSGYFFLRNGQLYDLGFDADHDNVAQIKDKIQELSEEIDLMMITEYYDESLLLLRKHLCWDFEDILYLSKGVRSEDDRAPITPDISRRIQKWNAGDVMLYDHFNRTFWQRVQDYGTTFGRDLAHFRVLKQKLMDQCFNSSEVTKRQNGRGNFTEFELKSNSTNSAYCINFQRSDAQYTGLIRKGMIQRASKSKRNPRHMSRGNPHQGRRNVFSFGGAKTKKGTVM